MDHPWCRDAARSGKLRREQFGDAGDRFEMLHAGQNTGTRIPRADEGVGTAFNASRAPMFIDASNPAFSASFGDSPISTY